MSGEEILDPYQSVDAAMHEHVLSLVALYGVPTTLDMVDNLTMAMLMPLVEQRRYLASRQREIMVRDYPTITPARAPFYPAPSLHKLIRRSVGLAPKATLARIEMFDAETQSSHVKSIAPWTEPDNPDVVDEVNRRLSAGTARHAKSASREVITRTAHRNDTYWARRLTGSETCLWCATQAARGAVFASAESAGFSAHDNCDCYAVLAPGDDWEGREESEKMAAAVKGVKTTSEFVDRLEVMANE